MVVAGQIWFKLIEPMRNNGDSTTEAGVTTGSMNILLLGTDARHGEKIARTDTIILAHVDPDNNRLCLLSIPRDSKVSIPRHGTDRINAANVYGGPELTAQVVSGLVGVPVKYYALTNWDGFKNIVDTLGGVNINVEKAMDYTDPTEPQTAIHLKPGLQRMDGNKALQYVRYRNDALGDISRTERQLNFLKAVANEMSQASTILKLPKLVPEINASLKTNLSLKQMASFALMAKDLDQVQIVTQTLPGYFLDQGGVSYWAVDPAEAKKVAQSLFTTGQVANVLDPTQGGSGYALAYKQAESKTESDETTTASTQSQPDDSDKETGDNTAIIPASNKNASIMGYQRLFFNVSPARPKYESLLEFNGYLCRSFSIGFRLSSILIGRLGFGRFLFLGIFCFWRFAIGRNRN